MVLLIACGILQFTRRRALGCWLLVLFPAALSFALLLDLAHGSSKLGAAAFNTDLRTLPYLGSLLLVALVGALRPRWRWLFWIAWVISAVMTSIAVYLTFFWKVFS